MCHIVMNLTLFPYRTIDNIVDLLKSRFNGPFEASPGESNKKAPEPACAATVHCEPATK